MSKLTDLTLKEASLGLAKKEFTSVELVTAHIEHANSHKDLNVFITETFDNALKAAKLADEKIASGKAGALEGLPIGIKDLYCTEGVRTTAASKMLENFVPEYSSTVVEKLNAAGTISLGKLNLDEFAMGSTTKTSYFGNTINPWKAKNHDKSLTPGGSSGGSAAAVSAGLVLATTGTDTGGSIRQPASFTGICGIKPTYGLCSRFGVVAFASSLDTMGPMARSVYDCAMLLEVMAGYDEKDSTSMKVNVPKYTESVEQGVKGLKIGVPKEYDNELLSSEVKAVWDRGVQILQEAGAEIVPISMPTTDAAVSTYYIIAPAEASSNLARYDGVRYGFRAEGAFSDIGELYMKTRSLGFGEEVKRRVLMGTEVLSSGFYDAYYLKACKVRRLIKNDFENAFASVDAILTPTTTGEAFALDAKMTVLEIYLNDIFTIPANMAGVPSMSVPVGYSENSGLPLGLQVMGKWFDEGTVFRVARVLEKESGGAKLPSVVLGE